MTIEDELDECESRINLLEDNIRELEEELDENENRKIIEELNAIILDQATKLGNCLEQINMLKMICIKERCMRAREVEEITGDDPMSWLDSAMQMRIYRMESQIEDKDKEIADLKDQIATLKDIAIHERANVLTYDMCMMQNRGDCTLEVDDFAEDDNRIAKARKQMEFKYEAMRK